MENIVQAISRDILAYAMNTLRRYHICGHIHDEVIIEAPKGTNTKAICEQMARTPPWIPGLLLHAEGFDAETYRKD